MASHATLTENAFQDSFLSPSNLAHDRAAGITLLRDKKRQGCFSTVPLLPSLSGPVGFIGMRGGQITAVRSFIVTGSKAPPTQGAGCLWADVPACPRRSDQHHSLRLPVPPSAQPCA